MSGLEGSWRVRRESGWLPPFGVTKEISKDMGRTRLFGLPVGRFRVDGQKLVYKIWPLRDELWLREDGTYGGRSFVLGLPWCEFTLVRR
jgi:hypothetical protein